MSNEQIKNSKGLNAVILHSNSKKVDAKRKYEYIINLSMESEEGLIRLSEARTIVKEVMANNERLPIDEIFVEKIRFFNCKDFEGYVIHATITAKY